MASHLDLEEQEQLANLKHFWSRYGTAIGAVAALGLAAYASYAGWQFWQRKTAQQAAVWYEQLEQAGQAADLDQIKRVWSEVQSQGARSLQGQQAGLLVAKSLADAQQTDGARQALSWVAEHSTDPGLQAVARLRWAALELDAQNPTQASKVLDFVAPPAFVALQADRRGDVSLAQGQTEAATQQYRMAWDGLKEAPEYRRVVQAKLNALGVNPEAGPQE